MPRKMAAIVQYKLRIREHLCADGLKPRREAGRFDQPRDHEPA